MSALRAVLVTLAIASAAPDGRAQGGRPPSLAPTTTPAPTLSIRLAEPSPADVALLAQCLADAREHPRACLGRIQKPCQETEAGQTTLGAMACADRERAVWSLHMTAAAQAVRSRLLPERTPFFDAAEDAWSAYRDASCRYEASAYIGGSLAKVESADCLLNETADHTVELEEEARGDGE